MFNWKDKRVDVRSIPPIPKSTKENEPKFIYICNRDEFLVESRETKQKFALVIKEEVTPLAEIPKKMRSLLESLKELYTMSFQKDYQP